MQPSNKQSSTKQLSNKTRWLLGLSLAALIVLVPSIHYRQTYRYGKRLRTMVEGQVYRSGCLTADGLRDAIQKYKIKTVLNLQEEAVDPALPNHYFTLGTTPESKVCQDLGVNFKFLAVELVNSRDFPQKQPPTIAEFLKLMDDPKNYPILFHCRAGLHRTGCLAAVYRQEYQGWSREEALRELKGHGFGEFFSTTANPYITQYVLGYQPRSQKAAARTGEQPFHGVSFNPLPSDGKKEVAP